MNNGKPKTKASKASEKTVSSSTVTESEKTKLPIQGLQESSLIMDSPYENPQLDLFQTFLCNTEVERDRLSNSIEFWDSIPKYSITRKKMEDLRNSDGFLNTHRMSVNFRGHRYEITIQPARITDDDGNERDYYPSSSEELVEEALRKLAAQPGGFFDRQNFQSGVSFTLNKLYKELAEKGHERRHPDIVKSLMILSGSLIQISCKDEKNEAFARTNFLPSLAAVSREQWLADPDSRWIAQFHPLVTQSISNITYRQYNYHCLMTQKTQLGRWIHRYLITRYNFASIVNPFKLLFSTIKRDSLLLIQKRDRRNVELLDKALHDLISTQVLKSIEKNIIKGSYGKIVDVEYTLLPSMEFIREVKAANKRLSEALSKNKLSIKDLKSIS